MSDSEREQKRAGVRVSVSVQPLPTPADGTITGVVQRGTEACVELLPGIGLTAGGWVLITGDDRGSQ